MFCKTCGKVHLSPNHHLPDFPQNPLDQVEDYLQMGLYSADTQALADQLMANTIRQGLSRPTRPKTPTEARWLEELTQEAGGWDLALAAAFGDRASEYFHNLQHRPFNRRRFLQQVLLGAAFVSLTNCATPPDTEIENQGVRLEKNRLKIAFLPITCATPIIIADSLGFYEKYGLTVELVKMTSWADVRDAAIAGEFDAYHLLSPMPIAMTLGLGSEAFPIKLASIENINGNAITVAKRHQETVSGPEDFKGFRIAIPFVYSMHNLLMRYYLAAGNLNPDQDVELITLPPPEMISGLKDGSLDAMIVAEPFNQLAVSEGVGFIHLLTQELWPGHPCCSFTATQSWIEEHPSTFHAVNKAIIEAAEYARESSHRVEVADAIASDAYVNSPTPIVESVLTGRFEDGLGKMRQVPDRIDFDPYPWKSFSYWITSQFVRWGLLPDDNVEHEAIADQVFMTGLARQLSKQLNYTPPTLILRYEELKYGRFDPTAPEKLEEEETEGEEKEE